MSFKINPSPGVSQRTPAPLSFLSIVIIVVVVIVVVIAVVVAVVIRFGRIFVSWGFG